MPPPAVHLKLRGLAHQHVRPSQFDGCFVLAYVSVHCLDFFCTLVNFALEPFSQNEKPNVGTLIWHFVFKPNCEKTSKLRPCTHSGKKGSYSRRSESSHSPIGIGGFFVMYGNLKFFCFCIHIMYTGGFSQPQIKSKGFPCIRKIEWKILKHIC